MHTQKISWAFFAFVLVLASCKRDNPLADEQQAANKNAVTIDAKDLAVPAGFNFDAEKTLNVRVKVADAKANERYAIKIYADVPSLGKLISTGLTNANAEYNTVVRVPAGEEYIYIEKIDPNGNSKYEKVKANQFASALFTNGQTPKSYIMRKSSGMDCSTGCTVTYNNPSTNITVNNGDVACITGTVSNNINVTVNGTGVAKICASGTFNEIIVNDGELYILESTIITVASLITIDGSFANYSDSLKVTSDFDFINTADGVNYGKIYTAAGGTKIFTETTFTNNGIINGIGGVTIWGTTCSFVNNNYIKSTTGSLVLAQTGTFTNNCYIETKYAEIGSIVINNGYIKTTDYFSMLSWGSSFPDPSVTLNDGAMISVPELQLTDGNINGTGSNRSKFKVTGVSTLSTGTTITGVLDLCDANGIETNNGSVQAPALASCIGYIATSSCNPEGFGTTTNIDTDNDGVADAQDEYPNDATRAFNSYYPNLSTMATVAFEDLWPSKADYDFNDLAVLFNIQQVLNANNEVVDYKVKLKVKAVGGTFVNGFGFQLDDLIPADITNVTGQVLVENLITRNVNNTEAGQSKAVIICYDSPEPTLQRAAGSMFNTIKTNGTGTSDTVFINISFTTPVASTKLSIDKFNPFIFTNKRRGYEVHLGNFAPTNLATTSLFGTFEDRTNVGNGVYYKNSQGLPWAILIPAEFSHPKEKTPITSAYNFFDDWAISGGTTYTNWYSNAVGNQNSGNIY